MNDDLEAIGDATPGLDPMIEGTNRQPRHRVKGHERTIQPRPPKPPPPGQERLFDLAPYEDPPGPRTVPVRPHLRRNPQRKATEMSTTTEPRSPAMEAAMREAQAQTAGWPTKARARRTDPQTSHGAAQAASGSLRRRMAEVLRVHQEEDAIDQKVGEPLADGLTDDELLSAFAVRQIPASPSGIRTARKDLERLGLIEALVSGSGLPVQRQTRLGNWAQVYVVTETGRTFPCS